MAKIEYKISSNDSTVKLKNKGLILSLNNNGYNFIKDNRELFKGYKKYKKINNEIYLKGKIQSSTLKNLEELKQKYNSGLEDYNVILDFKGNNQKNSLKKKNIISGQKSLIIQFKENININNTILNQTNYIDYKLIANDIYLINYKNEKIACDALNLLHDLETVKYIEPNLKHSVKEGRKKRKLNLDHDANIKELDFDPNHLLQNNDFREYINEYLKIEDINIKQYTDINFHIKNTKYGNKTIKIGIADSNVELSHNCFNHLKNEPTRESFLKEIGSNSTRKNQAHGTAVAGLAVGYEKKLSGSEKIFRGIGAGCMFHNAIIMSMYEDGGYFITTASIIQGLYWLAINKEVDIINNSWEFPYESNILNSLIRELSSENEDRPGVVFVFAAGNNKDKVVYPANLKEVITVGAISLKKQYLSIENNDHITIGWYSCEGVEVDISAPGSLLISSDISLYDYGNDIALGNLKRPDYAFFPGTSASAPIVSGAIALLFSLFPNIKRKEIIKQLFLSVQKPEGWKEKLWGAGILDINQTIENIKILNQNH